MNLSTIQTLKKNNMKTKLFLLACIVSILSCSDDTDMVPVVEYDPTPYVLEYGSFPAPAIPEDNQLTQEIVDLGRMLFFEKRLSKDNSQSCASCHSQTEAFSDSLQFSIGVEDLPGKRQAMAVFNMAWNTNEFFWDGRAHLLRDQAVLPIQDPLEMNETIENVLAKLSADQMYLDQFKRAFNKDEILIDDIALAMEQFMLSIVSIDSKYDQFLAGEVELTDSEERGRQLYFAEYNPFFPELSGADCQHCHGGLNFENDRYMNNGLDTDAEFEDLGREEVTKRRMDRAKFKVPSLRNIEVTAPYMHDGRFKTLEEVIDHYNEGIKESSTVDPAILNTQKTGLFLTDQDKQDLINFLKTLTDPTFLDNEEYKDPFL